MSEGEQLGVQNVAYPLISVFRSSAWSRARAGKEHTETKILLRTIKRIDILVIIYVS